VTTRLRPGSASVRNAAIGSMVSQNKTLMILTRSNLTRALTFVATGMLVSSCTAGSYGSTSSARVASEAKDFCPEIIELVDEFNDIAYDSYSGDDIDTLEDMTLSAKRMSGLVKRAEREGIDLAKAELLWLKNLGLSADSFVILAQAGPDTFSEEELRGYLERIIGWYDAAADECRVVVAQSLS